jgi:regulator of replication initiation timing
MAQTKPPKSALKRLAELETICADLENQLAVLQAERDSYKEKYEDILVENIRLQEKLTEVRERLRKHEPLVEKPVAEDVPEEEAQAEEDVDCFAGLPLKVAVIGGTEAWQAKVVARHPGFKIIGSNKNFDRDKLAGTDILVINTNAVSHACTQKAKSEVSKGAEILIVSSNNLEILDRKINALLA